MKRRPPQGAYLLYLDIHRYLSMETGRLSLRLKPGAYMYAGSAHNNLFARIFRHLRPEKSVHWHIDHLTTSTRATIPLIWATSFTDRTECHLLRWATETYPQAKPIPGFGNSDCRQGCLSHLLFLGPQSVWFWLDKSLPVLFTI